ncbi:MAG: sigma-70 family RNA polymerase sigma factor [Clostridia bacterium]|nr:sigma-70 family RNA polymerase sigma factor [Clostridia bacterium]MBQ3153640.1 sigma-70 family RNA polymerase sigma factor [Clostridia bacterium]
MNGISFSADEKSKIYTDFYPKVNAYVRGKIADPHEAEDIVSSVFLRVYEKLDSYDPSRASLSTWIYTISHNTVVDYFRKRRVHTQYAEYMDADLHEIADDTAPDNELLEQLADALSALGQKERDLIVLHYYKGYTLKVIAEMMGMSYANAKVIHTKALANLRGRM